MIDLLLFYLREGDDGEKRFVIAYSTRPLFSYQLRFRFAVSCHGAWQDSRRTKDLRVIEKGRGGKRGIVVSTSVKFSLINGRFIFMTRQVPLASRSRSCGKSSELKLSSLLHLYLHLPLSGFWEAESRRWFTESRTTTITTTTID